MNKFKNILFEYSTLLGILLIIFLSKHFLYTDMNNSIFIFALFFFYFRHHHKGEKIIQERVSKRIIATKSIEKRRILHWLDIPTFWVFIIFTSDWVSFYIAALLFVLWFVLTDILRARTTIHGQYISRWFYTSKININNDKWDMHKADKDPFPSVPHMHSKNYPLKLNIYTGEIFDSRTHKYIETASKKDLKKLWADNKFRDAVNNARNVYQSDHPKYKFPAMPTFD